MSMEGKKRRWYEVNGHPRYTREERAREADRVRLRPEYRYCPCGRIWAVYRYETTPDGLETGTKVCSCLTRDEARRETFRLNGWRYDDLI